MLYDKLKSSTRSAIIRLPVPALPWSLYDLAQMDSLLLSLSDRGAGAGRLKTGRSSRLW